MIVHYAPEDGLSLQESEDFRKFKIVLTPGSPQRPQVPELTFVDDDNALIGIDVVPALPGAPTDSVWREGYAKMVAAAAKLGWIDEQSNAIRAHVERLHAVSGP
jgi:hypothetical protein